MSQKDQKNYMIYAVVGLEWILTIAIAIKLILTFEHLLKYKSNSSDGAIILTGFIFVAVIIFHIGLDFILTRGVRQRAKKLLFIWTIIQYGLFVLTFPVIIFIFVGYINLDLTLFIVIFASLFYRVFILKVITDLGESIDEIKGQDCPGSTKPKLPGRNAASSIDTNDGKQDNNGVRLKPVLRGSTRIKAMNVPPPPPPVPNHHPATVSNSRPTVPPRPHTLVRKVSEV